MSVRCSRAIVVLSAATALCLVLGGCGAGRTDNGSGPAIVVGTTDRIASIDPASAYDNGSTLVHTQVFSFLLNFPAGASTPQPDAASKCGFTSPKVYSCTMKPNLRFANGDPLNARSAAFSFRRIVKINDPNGPASLLENMKSVSAPNVATVNFTLKSANDQTFPQVLATPAGPLLDQKVFPADKVLDDDAVVKARPFSGPYTIGNYQKNQLAQFKVNPDYDGAFGKPKNDAVTLKYYTDPSNLKLDIQQGDIDVAWRSLTPTDVSSLRRAGGVRVDVGAGGELRYIVFNLKTQPGNSEAQKLAVRKAMAYSVDRQALSQGVYKGTYAPAYSIVPDGVLGASPSFKSYYGASPSKSKAQQALSTAGVRTPVTVNLQYNTDHYGSSSDQEYNAIKRQLEGTGLFTVKLRSTGSPTYADQRVADAYPVYQLGWFPDFPDADNYLTPFLGPNNFIDAHYRDAAVTKQLDAERTQPDKAMRYATMKSIQDTVARQVPILPLLVGNQVAVSGNDISGTKDTLDSAFKLRFTALARS